MMEVTVAAVMTPGYDVSCCRCERMLRLGRGLLPIGKERQEATYAFETKPPCDIFGACESQTLVSVVTS
jgi:hypothetical protein